MFCMYLDVLRKIWTLLYSMASGAIEALHSRFHWVCNLFKEFPALLLAEPLKCKQGLLLSEFFKTRSSSWAWLSKGHVCVHPRWLLSMLDAFWSHLSHFHLKNVDLKTATVHTVLEMKVLFFVMTCFFVLIGLIIWGVWNN